MSLRQLDLDSAFEVGDWNFISHETLSRTEVGREGAGVKSSWLFGKAPGTITQTPPPRGPRFPTPGQWYT